MSYRANKQVIDTHTHGHTDRHTDAGDDNTRRPKLPSGKNDNRNNDVITSNIVVFKIIYVKPEFCLINIFVLQWVDN